MKKGCLLGCLIPFILIGVMGVIIQNVGKNAKEKAAAEEKTVEEQKEYYLNTVKPEIDKFIDSYDNMWEEGWEPNISGLSHPNVNINAVYNNLQIVKDTYMELSVTIGKIPLDGLNELNQEELKKALNYLSYAAVARQMAAEKAIEMVDQGNYSPSHLEKIQTDIASSVSHSNSAFPYIAAVELNLGVITLEENEEEKQQ